MGESKAVAKPTLSDWFQLMKPGVLSLLQVVAMCAILVHDLIQWNIAGRTGFDLIQTVETMAVVFVGGYLTAGGAHTFNNVIDRDIDPMMARTAERAIARGSISPTAGLLWALTLSISGTVWLAHFANAVAAFWAAFSILFYVFIYTPVSYTHLTLPTKA